MASKRKRDPFWHQPRIRVERANCCEYVVRDYAGKRRVTPKELFRGEKVAAEDYAQAYVHVYARSGGR